MKIEIKNYDELTQEQQAKIMNDFSENGGNADYLNGADEWYKRRDFIKLAKRYEEDIEDWERP